MVFFDLIKQRRDKKDCFLAELAAHITPRRFCAYDSSRRLLWTAVCEV